MTNFLATRTWPAARHVALLAAVMALGLPEVAASNRGPGVAPASERAPSTVAAVSSSCQITFRLTGTAVVGAVGFSVDYSDAGGVIPGTGNTATCSSLVPDGVLSAANDIDTRSVALGILSFEGFSAPADLVRCEFVSSGEAPSAEDFGIELLDLVDPGGVVVAGNVVVSQIDCATPSGCGNSEVDEGEDCDDGNTSSTDSCAACKDARCGDGHVFAGVEQCDDGNNADDDACSNECTIHGEENCVVTFRLTTTETVGNLSWKTSYTTAPGEFAGEGTGVECDPVVPVLLASLDDDATQTLTLGLITPAGLMGSIDIVECNFVAAAMPEKTDFEITVLEAGDTEANDIVPLPSLDVHSIVCGTATCGNEIVEGAEECDDGDVEFAGGDYCAQDCTRVQCGAPTQPQATEPKASDALFVLNAAVSFGACDARVCDVNDSGSLTATDALLILKAAVGISVELTCPG